ncbi:MAG: IPT/TIG domain-containing protein [Blastocatellia bacterium]|nr:IPT/TIG domain-containing protein [Blastocatellia bacterium]
MLPLRSRRLLAFFTLVCTISMILGTGPEPVQSQGGVTITVDASSARHSINPNIYGVAFATTAQLNDLNSPLNRWGGNPTTRYNWQQNCDNRAFDFYFESIAYGNATPGAEADTFISDTKTANAQAMMTIPLCDWIAKVGPNRSKLCSFSIAKYGQQQDRDFQYFPDAGNGVLTNGQNVVGNDPNDANTPNSSAIQQAWAQHLVTQWGGANNGGLKYYIMDNEPSIWFSTHRDVAPTGVLMEDYRNKFIDYATKIKLADPNAIVVGPEEWGWSAYILSGYDQQYGALHGYSNLPDRVAHNNMDYMPWLLQQLKQNQTATGKRLLDVFSLHFYPQGGEYSNDVSTSMQMKRNRSTRGLWDPNYLDEAWIGTQVQLIPRMKDWVSTYYPGTPTAITEYSWGAENHINGATAQADIFGIFGREGLDMATRWTTPAASTPTYKAMKMYRNYDGSKSTFGDTSVSATAPNPDQVSAFAAQRSSDGALTVMVINKNLSGSTSTTVNLANFSHQGTAQVWQLTSANTINHLSNLTVTGTSFSTTLPAQSVTLFVLPQAVGTAPTVSQFLPIASSPGKTITVKGTGFVNGQTQVFFGGTNLIPAGTVTVVDSTTLTAVVPATGSGAANINGYLTVRVNGQSATTQNLADSSTAPCNASATYSQFVLCGDITGEGLTAQASDIALARAFTQFQAVPTIRQRLAADVVPLNGTCRGDGTITTTDITFLRAVSFGQATF